MKLDPKQVNQYIHQTSSLLWLTDNKIKNEKLMEMHFKNHPFLKDIYDDWTPIQVTRKASQIGFSTMAILKTLWVARYRNYSLIYTLPSFQMASEFVSSKVNPMITNNKILSDWTKDKDSIFQKKVGNGFINYRGASSGEKSGKEFEAGTGIMISSDLNIHDECDRSSQIILEQYESRLSASEYKGRWYFSNPTHPNTLSQKLYERSDQKHWFVKCRYCNHETYLDYWRNIKDGKYVCDKCSNEFTDDDRRNGRWVKKYRNRDISGYWISHLIAPWIPASKIAEEFEIKDKQYFYNFVLGLPYIGSDISVNKDTILRNIDLKEPNFQKYNVLGVDQGLKKHWVLGNRQGIFKIGVCDSWKDIEDLIKTYDVDIAVFDALPDLTEPRKIRNKYPGKVWLNYYKKEIKKADFIKFDYKTRTVLSDRTKIIQQVIDEMVDKKIRFQMQPQELTEYIKHWGNVYKMTKKDRLEGDDDLLDRDVWLSQGEDHFVHATNYWRIGLKCAERGGSEVASWKGGEAKIYTGQAPIITDSLKDDY